MMNSKRIRFIIAIVTCSLVGILLLQGYWLYNAYRLASEQFDREVVDVVQQLGNDHAMADLKEMGAFPDTLKAADIKVMANVANFIRSSGDILESPVSRDVQDTSGRKTFSTSIVFSYQDSLQGKDALLDSVKNSLLPQEKATQPQRFLINSDSVKNFVAADFPVLATALQMELDSLFKARGINTDFVLSLSNLGGSGETYVSDSTFAHRPDKKTVSTKIGMVRPYILQLSVSNSINYILTTMKWVIAASILIIGITTWAFLYMIRTIFQQKRLSEIKNDFINNMTHEFKTPIATVSLAVEAMKSFDVLKKPEQVEEYLDICQHELNRISVMVEKVLKMAAFERTDIKLSFQKTDVGLLLDEVVGNMRPLLEKNQAHVSIKANASVEAMIDKDHMANVLYNLIDNSLKYADKPPKIEVAYGRSEDGQLLLAVKDNGIGIPMAYQERIFENFFRVPKGNIHDAKGFGLGLAYVATIVKHHGGKITVKSAPNEGSTFTMLFPTNQQLS